ncbi:unnamed protein product, partial [Staurois parvus]
SVCPLTLGVPIRVLRYISCPHQSAPLHQVSPSQCHLTSGIPIRVPTYTQSIPFHHIPHQSAPFHHMCQSDCPFPSHVPIRVPLPTVCAHLCPLNITCAHQSAP